MTPALCASLTFLGFSLALTATAVLFADEMARAAANSAAALDSLGRL